MEFQPTEQQLIIIGLVATVLIYLFNLALRLKWQLTNRQKVGVALFVSVVLAVFWGDAFPAIALPPVSEPIPFIQGLIAAGAQLVAYAGSVFGVAVVIYETIGQRLFNAVEAGARRVRGVATGLLA